MIPNNYVFPKVKVLKILLHPKFFEHFVVIGSKFYTNQHFSCSLLKIFAECFVRNR